MKVYQITPQSYTQSTPQFGKSSLQKNIDSLQNNIGRMLRTEGIDPEKSFLWMYSSDCEKLGNFLKTKGFEGAARAIGLAHDVPVSWGVPNQASILRLKKVISGLGFTDEEIQNLTVGAAVRKIIVNGVDKK